MDLLKQTYGFIKVAACVPRVRVADVEANTEEIKGMIERAGSDGVSLAVFPEMSLTGYTCADLFNQRAVTDWAEEALAQIVEAVSHHPGMAVVVGLPLEFRGLLYNCAAVVSDGRILGVVPKQHIPNYAEFYEKRWFTSGAGIKGESVRIGEDDVPFGIDLIFSVGGCRFGVEICEDLWVPQPPSGDMSMAGADIIVNLSASDENIGKHAYLRDLITQQSGRCRCGYVYASAGWGESSTDLIFSGNAIIACDGAMIAEGGRFVTGESYETAFIDVERLRMERQRTSTFFDGQSLLSPIRTICSAQKSQTQKCILPEGLKVNPRPFVPSDDTRLKDHCEEITSIQAWGLMQRLAATGSRKAVVGISGGLDSTLALLVMVKAFDNLGLPREGIIGITMPGFGTTDRTHDNAWNLMGELGVTRIEIPIGEAVTLHFRDIGHDGKTHDATYENSQARERTQILMDMANKTGGMVIGTGDLSELALGWCTYNGDQMSMYGVNASVPKTLVKYLVGWHAKEGNEKTRRLLEDIIDTPISPELIPAAADGTIEQKTEDLVGPYELHDFYLYHTLRNGFRPSKIYALACRAFENSYERTTILKWLRTFYRRFFTQQFKRSAMPDGPKVGSVCLSPRGDWRMPSDAVSAMWLKEVDSLGE